MEHYEALLKEYQGAVDSFSKAYTAAKTDEEQKLVLTEKSPLWDKLVPRFFELAEKSPNDPVAVAASLLRLRLASLPLPGRLVFGLDDTPTKRYGPKVQGAGIHHNPTPGPTGQQFLYGHVWVTRSLQRPAWCWRRSRR
jgi:hypothetical protein